MAKIKFTKSPRFDYAQVDGIISSDGSHTSEMSSIGWTISTRPSESIICSYRARVNCSSSLEAEIKSIRSALKEAIRIRDLSSVIIRCDFNGIVEKIHHNQCPEIQELLDKFKLWGVRSVSREKINRANMLAKSVSDS